MDCKLVPYGESEKRCVKCGYITWNNEKSDKEIIDDMIAMGYPVPNCRENTTKCECGANTSCQCGPEETNDSIEIDYSKVIKVQPRMVRESFPKEEAKQETLEEVAENNYYFESDIEMVNFISEMASTGKIPNRWSAFVAKINELYLFKQEQDKKRYSEEEVKKLIGLHSDFIDSKIDYEGINNATTTISNPEWNDEEWFEQVKKK
jgi:hypothetical protein